MALLPQGSIDYLIQAMPRSRLEGLVEEAYDYDSYLGKVSERGEGEVDLVTQIFRLLLQLY